MKTTPDFDRLRKRRRALDMRQFDLAEQLGISQSLMHHLERGTRTISADILRRWESALTKAERGALARR